RGYWQAFQLVKPKHRKGADRPEPRHRSGQRSQRLVSRTVWTECYSWHSETGRPGRISQWTRLHPTLNARASEPWSRSRACANILWTTRTGTGARVRVVLGH